MRGRWAWGLPATGVCARMDNVGRAGLRPGGAGNRRVQLRLLIVAVLVASITGMSTVAAAAPPQVPPNRGSIPSAAGQLTLPSAGMPGLPSAQTTIPVSTDPAIRALTAQETAVSQIGEKFNQASEELVPLTVARAEASVRLQNATEALSEKQVAADEWARSTYIDAAARPNGLEGAGHAPGRGSLPGTRIVDTPLTELAAAQREYDDAVAADSASAAAEQSKQQEVDGLRTQLDAKSAEVTTLRARHAEALAADQKRRDTQNNAISAQYLKDAAGLAGPQAIQAVKYALAQLGKPYEWGAEGPRTFDCSGLVQSAYGSAGVKLPRTARPQYRATKVVSISALLPGDLLFFATNKSDWNTVHHVAIYLGKGKMVHAPTFGDVVKIAPIWWSEFFAATRVVEGTAKPPAPKPTPKPTPGPKPTPSPTPSESPSPSPTPSPSPSSPSPTPTPSESPSPTPSTSSAPPGGGTPSNSPSNSTSPSPSPGPT